MKIGVTGSAGRVGSLICEILREDGHDVFEIDTAIGRDLHDSTLSVADREVMIHAASPKIEGDRYDRRTSWALACGALSLCRNANHTVLISSLWADPVAFGLSVTHRWWEDYVSAKMDAERIFRGTRSFAASKEQPCTVLRLGSLWPGKDHPPEHFLYALSKTGLKMWLRRAIVADTRIWRVWPVVGTPELQPNWKGS